MSVAEKLKVEVLLAAIDKATRPFKAITQGSSETAKALKAAKDALKQLNDAQGRIDSFRKVDKDLSIVRNGLKGAQDRIKALKAEIAKVPAPTKDMARALKEAQTEAGNLKGRFTTLLEKQQRLRTELNAAGYDTRNLANHQRDLAVKIKAATVATDQKVAAMKRENAETQRMIAARARYDKSMLMHGKVTQAGKMTAGAGITGALPIVAAVRQYASFEDAMLGVAKQVNGARDENGRLTATYFEMADAIQAMSERLPMTANDIAAIVEAGARMGIQGKKDLLGYAETAAVMATAFDLPVEQIGDNMAKVAALYKVPIANIKQLGDAINYLDDNSVAKGPEIIDVLQRIGGTATTLHMSYQQAAALGATFLKLGNGAETAASASEHMMKNLAIATMLPKRFQEGMAMIGMTSKNVQNSMSIDAIGTIVKVMESINKLPQNKQIEAATRLFGKEFGPDAAKLAGNLDSLREHLATVNAEKANGSMDKEMAARNQNLSSSYRKMTNVIGNLASDLGGKLKPELEAIMGAVSGTLQRVREWVKEHPGLSSALLKGAAILALVVTGLGALVFAIGAVMAPIALLRFGIVLMGGSIGGFLGRIVALLGPIGKLGMAFSAGYLVGQGVAALIDRVVSSIAGYKTTLGGFIFDVIQLFKAGDWSSIGAMIVRGIESGLDLLTGGLYSRIKALATGMVTAAKSALGIKSPSQVFAQIGSYTMAGLEKGIDAARQGPVGAVIDAARKIAAAGAGLMIGGAALAGGPAIDTRPPLSLGGAAGGGSAMSVTINVYPSPGMDEAALARQVAAEIQRIESQRAARSRSRLGDRD